MCFSRVSFPKMCPLSLLAITAFLSLTSLVTSVHCGCVGLTQRLQRKWAPGARFGFQSLIHQNKGHVECGSRKINALSLLCVYWGVRSNRRSINFIIISRMTTSVVNAVTGVPIHWCKWDKGEEEREDAN